MIVANTTTGITSIAQNGNVRLMQERYTTVLLKGRNMTKNEVIRGLLEIITADGYVPEKHKKVIAEAIRLLSEEKEKEYITVTPAVIPTPYYQYQTPCPTWDKVTITCDTNANGNYQPARTVSKPTFTGTKRAVTVTTEANDPNLRTTL